jgi:assimilatory nitrate reductase catalytic subunit
MHWGSQFMSGAGANALTAGAFDPYSKQPELKHAAVEVVRVELPNELIALRRLAPGDWTPLERLQPLLRSFPLAALSMFGEEHACIMLRARSDRPFESAEVDRAIAGDAMRSASYEDPARALAKRIWIDAGGRIAGARLLGDTAAAGWLKEQMQNAALIPPALALAPRPPAAGTPRGRMVCNCFAVSETEIRAAVAQGADLPALQRSLKCGTNCGSCVPELRRLCMKDSSISTAA